MKVYIIITLITLIPLGFQYYIIRNFNSPASDKLYHKLLIQLIKSNGNKPILKHSNILNSHRQSYPQLLHWMLSFLPMNTIEKLDKKVPVIMVCLNLIVFFFLLFFISRHFDVSNSNVFYLIATLFFVTTPYQYNISNAKNVGLSARGFGLFLSFMSSLFLIIHLYTSSWLVYTFCVISGVFILLSSQFSTQVFYFVIFTFGCLTLKWQVAALPFISTALFFIILPKLAYVSLIGQFEHKKLYYKHLAKRFILLHRFSIWRDIVYDIPRIIYHRFLIEDKRITSTVKISFRNAYIRRNSLIILFLELPVIVSVLIYGLAYELGDFKILWLFVVSCFIIFLITTFRFSRFLGEPERYLEYAVPFASAFAALVFSWQLIAVLISYSLFIIVFSLPKKKDLASETASPLGSDLNEVKTYLLENSHFVKLICVSLEDTKFLLDEKIKCFYYWINAEKNDEFYFSEVFPESFSYIGDSIIGKLVNRYKLNCILINKKIDKKYSVEKITKDIGHPLSLMMENDTYVLLNVQS
jgi:hypothetical protein